MSDARRATDLEYFRQTFGTRCVAVRITAGDEARAARGYVFTAGVDDAESECGLDHAQFDLVVRNDGAAEDVAAALARLQALALNTCMRLPRPQ